ncbi:MFS transporter [Mycobacterium attenuatum]|uniref:MFS transporter n=1 Tax=Mycobacterium attenuatum TaxID=2341086 RepID=UPI000F2D9224|nr:MFS transporter [Mycobacterium attenuatum]VBA46345.1 putative MFS-type transporter [Mycobacterium attenuatum]VBA48772.1 putative MFS-type transporter [Mycobacterium attenuatum]
MTTDEATRAVSTARRWSMLAISQTATLTANVFINGVAFLIPALANRGANLAQAALLASMPSFGMMLTLIAWGHLLDRVGERIVLTFGLALTAAAGVAAAAVHSMVVVGILLVLGGMAAASCISASGRLVTGWFPQHRRAVAMGIRQTAQPLGIAVAALVIPELAKRNFSVALLFPAALCALAAMASALGVHDPPRDDRPGVDFREVADLYRKTALWRIHFASALLMVPQPVVLTFMLVWFIQERRLSVAGAGALVATSQLLGALARIAAGRWSDRVGSRMRPVRTIAVVTTGVMVALAITDQLDWAIALAVMVVAAAITGDSGLPFTVIPEIAGPFWSGWALGKQNTFERLVVAVAPPVFAVVIMTAGYPLAFALCGLFPLVALPLVPVHTPPEHGTRGQVS